MSTDKQFIADLMPRLPIYVDLLPKAAQQVIGLPHETAAPAKAFLQSQGLAYDNYIDIFDGGPLISAPMESIKIVANSKSCIVKKIATDITNGVQVMIANNKLAMRSTVGNIVENGEEITISKDIAEILQITEEDKVKYVRI